MAKGARASTRKRNNAALRDRVFGPAHDARTQRLSEKLQQLAGTSKPEEEKTMEVDNEDEKPEEAKTTQDADEEEDIDMQEAAIVAAQLRKTKKQSKGGVKKRSARTKPKHQMVFPSEIARRKRQSKGKKT